MERNRASVKPGWENRPVAIPEDVDDPAVPKASGRVSLPLHIYWSGEDPEHKVWDLADPLERELVYRMVMIEGDDDDVRRFIDVDQVIAMWPNLFLPERVRKAWAAWLQEHRAASLECRAASRSGSLGSWRLFRRQATAVPRLRRN